MENKPRISLPEAIIMLLIAILSDLFELIVVLIVAGTSLVPFPGLILTIGGALATIISKDLAFIPAIGILSYAGPVISVFENFVVLALIQFWLIMKRVRGFWFLAGGLVEFLPFVNFLPIKTITLAITILLVNKGEKVPLVGRAAKAIAKK